jgi:hypothetical protein
MMWLIYIINFFLWAIAGIILGFAFESFLFGIVYFLIGYPLSLFVLKFSDNYAVSLFDRVNHSPFSVLKKKLLWSNNIAMIIFWAVFFLLAIIFG